MIVEHTFVTTLEEPEAMSAAAEMLQGAGFFDRPGPAPAARQWAHGLERPRNAAQAWKLVRLSYDRGRIAFAASARFARPDHAKLYEPVLVGLANAAETLLAARRPADDALAPVRDAIGAVYAYDRRRRLHTLIAFGVIGAAVAGAVALLVMSRH